ncbi:hypothetical protein [Croceicoccus hydrothermalis]|uniref:hypothetical protein n=1 Tax=Croceicoccus hydrothermalis TaxID=2867964 RepID=UPI001EFAD444|nr:hypothetical protein [Croceicoccus hydrothermalis]
MALAACGDGASFDPARDAADVAKIRATHDTPPVMPIAPERISYSDVEDNNLFGVSCAFAPGNGMAVMMMAMPDRAYMKLDGKIVSFAADKGSAAMPLGTWAQYDGREYAIRIAQPEGEAPQDGISRVSWNGSIAVVDGRNRPVYEESGTLQCGS